MRERFIRLGHLVGVFATLDCRTEPVRGIQNLVGQSLGHRLLAAGAGVLDEPSQGERVAAPGPDLDRDLVGRAADAPALHFELRLDVIERLAEDARLGLSREFLDAILAKGDRESGAAKSQIAAFAAAVRKLEVANPVAAAYSPGSIL